MKKSKIKTTQTPECLICENKLKQKEGHMEVKETKDRLFVFVCEDCDQAYVLKKDLTTAFIGFDSSMKRIQVFCKLCNKEDHFRERFVWIINNEAINEPHCVSCAHAVLIEWNSKAGGKNDYLNKHKDDVYEMQGAADVMNIGTMNVILQDREKCKELAKKHFGPKFEDIVKANKEIKELESNEKKKCANCGIELEPDSKEDMEIMRKEYVDNFGHLPREILDEEEIVCDGCYKSLMKNVEESGK